ncbi:malto-oligosyltrehalose trehalohydrolase [Acidithiobacillus sp. M4-SHS-6]|uniref:malto-oligosyltrehalose trehalohydrolase n=1 Tax=Acidithiobacillus sp. M4-SHS-6 TaxID=3383024 RepID=UPI0039BEAEF3
MCRHDMPFGAQRLDDGRWRFRLWAPAARRVELQLSPPGGGPSLPMRPETDGWFALATAAAPGTPYAYRIDGDLVVPDPASRAQLDDVQGPSLLVDPAAFAWEDGHWRGRPWEEAAIYELHTGSFSPEGTFAGVTARLDHLAGLGVTALELMPVADFPGARDWGYDGALPFAPDRRYGTPDDLKRLVQEAHRRGLMVFLDVVYNHFGPVGNYLSHYAPAFFTDRHHTPWGAAINFDGPGSRTVRAFFIHNALYWLEEFHMDGLRLDAVHTIRDDSDPDIVEELGAAVARRFPHRHVHLMLEDNRNSAHYLVAKGSRRLYAAQWNDDFHHALHVILTGETGGYYGDFADDPHGLLARCLAEGFAFQGDWSAYQGRTRGEPSAALPVTAFVGFLQNHDQVGNRACGERLATLATPQALRAATALLLLAPAPPLLFMGQEWGSRRPFPFFCDLGPELAPQVREGRLREFARFADFADAAGRARIPDPSDPATFRSARLDWRESEQETQRAWLALHRELLALRRRELVPRLAGVTGEGAAAARFGTGGVAARWHLADGMVLVAVANLDAAPTAAPRLPAGRPLYATPGALGSERLLPPWAAAFFLCAPRDAGLDLDGTALFGRGRP